jgi:hypothetical protein
MTTIDFISWFFIVACLATIVLGFAPALFNAFRSKDGIKNISDSYRTFISAEVSDNVGRDFVHLTKYGYFMTTSTVNHGVPFNDTRHLNDFRKYNTLEMAAALNKIGEEYGQYRF